MAGEPQQGHQQRAQHGGNHQVGGVVLAEAHIAETAAQAQQGEGQNVVEQNAQHNAAGGGHPGHIVQAQQQLNQGVDETGHQPGLDTPAHAQDNDGGHAQQGDGAAIGGLVDLDHAQHGGQSNHNCALGQNVDGAILFVCHCCKPPTKNVASQPVRVQCDIK